MGVDTMLLAKLTKEQYNKWDQGELVFWTSLKSQIMTSMFTYDQLMSSVNVNRKTKLTLEEIKERVANNEKQTEYWVSPSAIREFYDSQVESGLYQEIHDKDPDGTEIVSIFAPAYGYL